MTSSIIITIGGPPTIFVPATPLITLDDTLPGMPDKEQTVKSSEIDTLSIYQHLYLSAHRVSNSPSLEKKPCKKFNEKATFNGPPFFIFETFFTVPTSQFSP